MDLSEPAWLPIRGFEGLYEISNRGGVRSLDRRILRRNGVWTTYHGKELKPYPLGTSDHLCVDLRKDGCRYPLLVHRLVLEHFVGLAPQGSSQALHWDDDATNNCVSNLRWGDFSDNLHDRVRNGKHHNANKTHCPQRHEYTPENTYRYKDGRRECWICKRARRKQ